MARVNKKKEIEPIFTHGEAKAVKISPYLQLKRSVMSCMLWENEFYEDGVSIAKRIADLIPKVDPQKVYELAVQARTKGNLRHVPLWIVINMLQHPEHKKLVRKTIASIIQRPDELTELLALYWKDGKKPIAASLKKGLADAFKKFNRYQLGKYNQNNSIKLRDVLFMIHAKPKDNEQAILWNDLANNRLEFPKDAWEKAISVKGVNKKKVWETLLSENKLGILALLRNLRNFQKEGVAVETVREAFKKAKVERALPFRFITAATHAPRFEQELEQAMFKNISSLDKLKGETILIVDTSGSMRGKLDIKSEMSRMDSAIALAILAREQCENCVIYITAGNDRTRTHSTGFVPARHGFALRDIIYEIKREHGEGGIFLTQCMDFVYNKEKEADRIIVFTDEQDCDNRIKLNPARANAFGKQNYLVNIASAKNGIGYGKWVHIDGFSQAVLDFINEYERSLNEEESENGN